MTTTKDKEDRYWLSNAWFYTRVPTIVAIGFLFPGYAIVNGKKHWSESELAPDNPVLKIPFYVAASALALLTLPIGLIIGLVALPVAALHDLFVGIGQCFEQETEEHTSKPIL